MTGKPTKSTGSPALPERSAVPSLPSGIDDRIARLRKEKELLELELEVNVLRRRAAELPDRKTF